MSVWCVFRETEGKTLLDPELRGIVYDWIRRGPNNIASEPDIFGHFASVQKLSRERFIVIRLPSNFKSVQSYSHAAIKKKFKKNIFSWWEIILKIFTTFLGVEKSRDHFQKYFPPWKKNIFSKNNIFGSCVRLTLCALKIWRQSDNNEPLPAQILDRSKITENVRRVFEPVRIQSYVSFSLSFWVSPWDFVESSRSYFESCWWRKCLNKFEPDANDTEWRPAG